MKLKLLSSSLILLSFMPYSAIADSNITLDKLSLDAHYGAGVGLRDDWNFTKMRCIEGNVQNQNFSGPAHTFYTRSVNAEQANRVMLGEEIDNSQNKAQGNGKRLVISYTAANVMSTSNFTAELNDGKVVYVSTIQNGIDKIKQTQTDPEELKKAIKAYVTARCGLQYVESGSVGAQAQLQLNYEFNSEDDRKKFQQYFESSNSTMATILVDVPQMASAIGVAVRNKGQDFKLIGLSRAEEAKLVELVFQSNLIDGFSTFVQQYLYNSQAENQELIGARDTGDYAYE